MHACCNYQRSRPKVISPSDLPGYQGKEGQKYSLCAPVFSDVKPSLGDMGIGISLYFDTVKLMGWAFLAMFVFGLPSIIVTFIANPDAPAQAVEDGGPLAALKVFTVSAMFKTSSTQDFGCNEQLCYLKGGVAVETKSLAYVLVYFDLAYCIIFIYSIGLIQQRFDRLIRDVDEGNVTAADFTVSVWGLPPDCTEQTLKAHFDRYDGTVCPEKVSAVVAAIANMSVQTEEMGAPVEAGNITPKDIHAADIEAPQVGDVMPGIKIPHRANSPLDAVIVDGGNATDSVEGAKEDDMEDPLTLEQCVPNEAPGAMQGAADNTIDGIANVSGTQFGEGDFASRGFDADVAKDGGRNGGVADVFLVRRDAEVLIKMQTIGMLIEQLQDLQQLINLTKNEKTRMKAELKKTKLLEKKEKLEASLKEKVESNEVNPVCGAFVMFHTEHAQQDCLRHYSSKGSRPLLPCLLPRPELILDGKHQLRINDADEPSDVLWENLEVNRTRRFFRKLISSLASFLVILISVAIIVYGKTFNEKLKVVDTTCVNASTIADCNSAINWDSTTTHGCPGGLASCTLAEVWDVSSSKEQRATPLHLDTGASPLKTSILNANHCRAVPDTGDVLLPSAITSQCKKDAAITESQWLALINIGYNSSIADEPTCKICSCKALQDSGSLLWFQSFGDSAILRTDSGEATCTSQVQNDIFFCLHEQFAVYNEIGSRPPDARPPLVGC